MIKPVGVLSPACRGVYTPRFVNTPARWTETIPPGEDALFERYGEKLRDLQRAYGAKRSLGRALHYKSHGGFRGELRTHGDLPAWAKVGVFASETTLPAYVRFSNGAGRWQRDRADDVRGVAVKLVGVPGRKLIPGMEDAKTQDFLAIHAPRSVFATPEEFVGVVSAVAGNPLLILPRIISVAGFGRTFAMLGELKKSFEGGNVTMAKRTFYSALPIRWGEAAVKYALVPRETPDGDASAPGDDNHMATDLASRLARGAMTYELRIQAFVDEATTPIEDPTRVWDDSASPWVTVATLTIVKQDARTPEGEKLAKYVETLSFDPWHAPEEFRPLGAMMRARAKAYKHSAIERKSAPEPDGTETW